MIQGYVNSALQSIGAFGGVYTHFKRQSQQLKATEAMMTPEQQERYGKAIERFGSVGNTMDKLRDKAKQYKAAYESSQEGYSSLVSENEAQRSVIDEYQSKQGQRAAFGRAIEEMRKGGFVSNREAKDLSYKSGKYFGGDEQ